MVSVRTARVTSKVQRLGHGLNGPGFESRLGQDIFSSPKGPDGLWGPPNLWFNRYRGCFSEGKAAGAWCWRLHPAPRLPTPCKCLHGVERNNFTFFTLAARFNAKCPVYFLPYCVCVCRMILTINSVSLYSIPRMAFIMEARCLFCEVRTESSYVILSFLVFRVVTTLSKPPMIHVGLLLQLQQ